MSRAAAKPSRGAAGVYRWLDPTAEIAELPRECCDYLHDVQEREQQAKLEKAQAERTSDAASAQAFDPEEDQAKYFKDMPAGQRRPLLRQIACRLAAGGADVKQIVSVLNYQNERFTDPVSAPGYIARVASGAVMRFARGNRLGKRFAKGETGNVHGRPRRTKVSEALTAKLAETYPPGSETTIADYLAQALIKEAIKGNVMAIREVCDRTEGRSRQSLDVDMNVTDWREVAKQYGLSEKEVLNEAERLIQSATGGGGTNGGTP